MKKSLISMIIDHIFGRKYYIVSLKDLTGDKLPHYNFVSSYIFLTRDLAQTFIDTNVQNASRSALPVSIHSFRTKKNLISNYNPSRHLDYNKLRNLEQ